MKYVRKILVLGIGSKLLSVTLLAVNADDQLVLALLEHNPAQVKQALDNGAVVNRVVEPQSGMTLLDSAISHADLTMRLIEPQQSAQVLEIIELLLEKGADVNVQGYQGYTSLMIAPMSVEIVELLLRYGADPTVVNLQGESALNRAYQHYSHVIELLLFYPALLQQAQEQPSRELLSKCIEKGYFTLVKLLLASGITVALSDLERAQALYNQVKTVRSEIIVKLLQKS